MSVNIKEITLISKDLKIFTLINIENPHFLDSSFSLILIQ